MREVKIKESWDRKRIAVAILILALIAGLGYGFMTNAFSHWPKKKAQNEQGLVKGTSSQEGPTQNGGDSNIGSTVSQSVGSIKKEISNINLNDIASSSPQIQKVINDIKNLQNYPANQAKDACFKICSSL